MEYADILETNATDSGYCPSCLEHIDSGRCECTEEMQSDGFQGCTCRGDCTC